MLFHKMKYTFKYLFKNKSLLFWTFIFPIILGSCFYLAFKNIESKEALSIIDIAIVTNDEFNKNELYVNTFKTLSDKENKDRLFNIKYVNKEEAEKLLEEEKIVGYLYLEEEANVVIKKNGINETIFKVVVDEINSNAIIIDDYIKTIPYEELYKKISELNNSKDYTNNKTNNNMSYTMIEYYTLIAMAALYSGILSINVIINEMANISSKGKRNSIAPIKKSTSIIGSLFASYITGLIGLAILFIFTIFVIHVDYGSSLLKVILMGIVGVLAGSSLGIFIGSYVKGTDNTKTGVLIAFSMAGSFFSGMMGITMKYIIDTNIPIINLVNPAAMITDGLYSLYYYTTFDKYYFDIISLLIFSIILIILSIIKIRRVRYDSI